MQYAIELFFDQTTEAKLNRLIELVADRGISTKFIEWKTRPHIALACYNDVDEERCIEILKKFAASHEKEPAYLDSVGVFNDTKIVFATPTMTRRLYDLQSELHAAMNDFDTSGWEWYCPDGWVPHCTLAMTAEDGAEAFFKAAELILHEFEKIEGVYCEIGLVKCPFPAEEIYTAELK